MVKSMGLLTNNTAKSFFLLLRSDQYVHNITTNNRNDHLELFRIK